MTDDMQGKLTARGKSYASLAGVHYKSQLPGNWISAVTFGPYTCATNMEAQVKGHPQPVSRTRSTIGTWNNFTYYRNIHSTRSSLSTSWLHWTRPRDNLTAHPLISSSPFPTPHPHSLAAPKYVSYTPIHKSATTSTTAQPPVSVSYPRAVPLASFR
ncbi:hypothetical protein K503DRAFT_91724 [Rhizopogon vinicolor AM-OR11-026]|uniref:Uncharacterized protein n=1 Tax=Rhizopogon vinicolor AM-OR11-026 TaxID=1314800 RepID=A0A1B7MFL6_9AGAM|nr:hypothetical protein K503DRAFT_91724 [Rhizopogon vinicolor AM-OR11-026]